MCTAHSSSHHGGSAQPPGSRPPWSRHPPEAGTPPEQTLHGWRPGDFPGQIPLNFPLGCGPGEPPGQISLNFPLVVGLETPQLPQGWSSGNLQGMLGYQALPWRPAARHAGILPARHVWIPASPPVNGITDSWKNITCLATSFTGGKNFVNYTRSVCMSEKLKSP